MGSSLNKIKRSRNYTSINVYDTPDVQRYKKTTPDLQSNTLTTSDAQSNTQTLNPRSSLAAGLPTERRRNDDAFQRQRFRSQQNAEHLGKDMWAIFRPDEQTNSETIPLSRSSSISNISSSSSSSSSVTGLSKKTADDRHDSRQRVRATSDCEANRKEEINFKTGDIMEIIVDISRDGYYLVKNTKSLKTGYVLANKVRKIIDEIEALEGFCDVDRETAEECSHENDIELGSYLIRPSNDEDCYALSVLCQNEVKRSQVRHYKIAANIDGMCYIHVNDSCALSFPSVKRMIKQCSEHPILGNKLTEPYLKHLIFLKEFAIDVNDIDIGKKLGNGHFATVYEGTLRGSERVAVKSLKPGGALSVKDCLAEAYMMHKLRHERLVKLIGFCINPENSGVYIVMEKMSKGDLKNLLLKDRGKEIKFSKLLTMAIQIAEGMSYLESQNFVHRDLRAANILVSDSCDVKIADFGLGRILDQYYQHVHFYVETKGAPFPFKWTALEALRTLHFTLKSDVWSFGILLYEIFTYGEEFYLGMNNREAVDWVVKGNRLEKPIRHHCPETLYRLMLTCWNEEPTERPTFEMIKTTLIELMILV